MQSAKECSRQSWRKRAWVRLTRLRSDSNATVCSHSFHPLNQPARTPTWSRNIMIWWAGSRYQDLGSLRGWERDGYDSMTMLCSSIENHHADVSKNTLAFTFTWDLTENSPLICYLLVGTNVLHHWSWVLELGLAVGNPWLNPWIPDWSFWDGIRWSSPILWPLGAYKTFLSFPPAYSDCPALVVMAFSTENISFLLK